MKQIMINSYYQISIIYIRLKDRGTRIEQRLSIFSRARQELYDDIIVEKSYKSEFLTSISLFKMEIEYIESVK